MTTLWATVIIGHLLVTLFVLWAIKSLKDEIDSASIVIGYILLKTKLTGNELEDNNYKP
jgi:hypothetical protein